MVHKLSIRALDKHDLICYRCSVPLLLLHLRGINCSIIFSGTKNKSHLLLINKCAYLFYCEIILEKDFAVYVETKTKHGQNHHHFSQLMPCL